MALEKDAFFDVTHNMGFRLAYDDVQVVAIADDAVTRETVNTASFFSRGVELQVPIVSSAMDTVTESKMAITVAKLGGIGVVHYALSPEKQREEVRRVKLEMNGRVEKPVTFQETDTLEAILAKCEEEDFSFRTFPITDSDGKFAGLLTSNDFTFAPAASTAAEAMTPSDEVMHAPAGTSLHEAYEKMLAAKKKTLPLLNEDGTVAGMYVFQDVERIVTGNKDRYNLDENGRLRVAAAVPTDESGIERVRMMMDSSTGIPYLDVAVLDSAQGDSVFALRTLRDLKAEFPNLDVVAGNISEPESAIRLAEAGADGIKVGQGPGSICTTRIETGIGGAQLSAVYDCAKAVDVPVCADGGIKYFGDISKAIVAGASSVMLGSMLAGTSETPGKIITHEDGSRVKVYRGMGSEDAIRESAASRVRYGGSALTKPLPEGVSATIPYKGSVVGVIEKAIEGLRKGMVYAGSIDIKAHQRDTRFNRNTNAGMLEARPHIQG